MLKYELCDMHLRPDNIPLIRNSVILALWRQDTSGYVCESNHFGHVEGDWTTGPFVLVFASLT